jgi:hypothetical protein
MEESANEILTRRQRLLERRRQHTVPPLRIKSVSPDRRRGSASPRKPARPISTGVDWPGTPSLPSLPTPSHGAADSLSPGFTRVCGTCGSPNKAGKERNPVSQSCYLIHEFH